MTGAQISAEDPSSPTLHHEQNHALTEPRGLAGYAAGLAHVKQLKKAVRDAQSQEAYDHAARELGISLTLALKVADQKKRDQVGQE